MSSILIYSRTLALSASRKILNLLNPSRGERVLKIIRRWLRSKKHQRRNSQHSEAVVSNKEPKEYTAIKQNALVLKHKWFKKAFHFSHLTLAIKDHKFLEAQRTNGLTLTLYQRKTFHYKNFNLTYHFYRAGSGHTSPENSKSPVLSFFKMSNERNSVLGIPREQEFQRRTNGIFIEPSNKPPGIYTSFNSMRTSQTKASTASGSPT